MKFPADVHVLRRNAAQNAWRLLCMGFPVLMSFDLEATRNGRFMVTMHHHMLLRLAKIVGGVHALVQYKFPQISFEPLAFSLTLSDEQAQRVFRLANDDVPVDDLPSPLNLLRNLHAVKITFAGVRAYVDVWSRNWDAIQQVRRSSKKFNMAAICANKAADVNWLLDRAMPDGVVKHLLGHPRKLEHFRCFGMSQVPTMHSIQISKLSDLCMQTIQSELEASDIEDLLRMLNLLDVPEYDRWLRYSRDCENMSAFWIPA